MTALMTEAAPGAETGLDEIRVAVRHAAVYGFGAVAAKALGFLMLPVYTRFLSPADYGVLEILDLSMSLFGMFLNMGMTAALLRYYGIAQSADERKQVVSTAFIFVAISGAIAFVIGLGAVRAISAAVLGPAVPSRYLLLSFSSFILAYVTNVPRTYLRALEASGKYALLDTASVFSILTLNIVFIVVLKIGLVGILLSALIVNTATLSLCVWTVRRVGLRFSRRTLLELMEFGLPLVFSNLALFVLNFADRFFLQHLQSIEVVGIYAVGYKCAYMMNFLMVQPFYVMWQARMYAIHKRTDHANVFGQLFMLYAVLLTYAGLALGLFSSEFVHFMVSSRFAASRDVIPIVVLAYVFHGLAYYAQTGMLLVKRTKLVGLVSAMAAGVNIVMNWLLIPKYGMLGAAWATVTGFFVIAVGSYYFSQRSFRLPLKGGRAMMVILVGVGLYGVSQSWQTASIAQAMLFKCALLASFPVLIWQLRILSGPERRALASISSYWTTRMLRIATAVSGGQKA
jgi:O-antigen/teichoic acid export membrane protein